MPRIILNLPDADNNTADLLHRIFISIIEAYDLTAPGSGVVYDKTPEQVIRELKGPENGEDEALAGLS